ncbi:MAG: stage II sporulation protein D [Epulopiscium sp.]|nr:stage II sporulation protein D [Candidatus Epulonipiscium sp.]
MKKIGTIFLAMMMILFLLPVLVTWTLKPEESQLEELLVEPIYTGNNIKVQKKETGEIITLDFEEYIKGVVAAEMPANFEEEALKAQAVAARTYALRRILERDNQPLETRPPYHITTDFRTGQSYLNMQELKERWGETNFYTYYEKVAKAVIATQGEIMVYEEEPIEAVFHSTSAGMTQSAKDLWTMDLPYLQSVDSIKDVQAPSFLQQMEFTVEEFLEKVVEAIPEIVIGKEDVTKQMQIIERNPAGYVKQVQIGNQILTGQDLRGILGLASNHFTIEETEQTISFLTQGYGHGVGMSQYGAHYMAQEGKDYREILQHYYQGIQIEKMQKYE